jgi:hypothetical protein
MIDLVLLITLSADAECAAADHRCRAERFARHAEASKTPADRVRRLYAAHREYLDLHARTGEATALCEARRLLDAARALKATPAYLEEAIEKTEAETRQRESGLSGRCKRTASGRPAAKKPEVARAEPVEPAPVAATADSASEPVPLLVSRAEPTQVEPAPAAEEPDPLLSVRARRISNAPPASTSGPTPAPRLAVPPPRDPRRRARVGGGIGLLAAGGGLFAGMAVSLAERAEVTRSFRGLDAAIDAEDRDATDAEREQVARLDRQYGLLTFAAGATGVVASVAVVSGVSLIAIPTRRTRTLALPWTGPRAAGIVLRGHF